MGSAQTKAHFDKIFKEEEEEEEEEEAAKSAASTLRE